MAGKKQSDADLDAEAQEEVMEQARQIVRERRRKAAHDANPYWQCNKCGFKNRPRLTHPSWTQCEQCGKERDESDMTLGGTDA